MDNELKFKGMTCLQPLHCECVCACVFSCVWLFVNPPGSSVPGISQARMLERVAFPPPGDLPDPGIELVSLASLELVGGFFTTEPPGKPLYCE